MLRGYLNRSTPEHNWNKLMKLTKANSRAHSLPNLTGRSCSNTVVFLSEERPEGPGARWRLLTSTDSGPQPV